MDIQNKVVVITGGASGLGKAAAQYLVREKSAKIAILDLNESAGTSTAAELGEANSLFCRTDVASEDSIDEAVATIMSRFGSIHANINAAAIPNPGKILDKEGVASSLDRFAQVLTINLCGVYNVMAKCAEQMAKNEPDKGGERGVIVNISSGAAFEGQIGQCAYSASKAGINGLNIPAARELGALGIRVNSIAPGLFGTSMAKSLDRKVLQALEQMIEAPKRLGEPEEFAHACSFLIENGYMNGRVLRLDAATILRAR